MYDFLTDFSATFFNAIAEYTKLLVGSKLVFDEYIPYRVFGIDSTKFETMCGVVRPAAVATAGETDTEATGTTEQNKTGYTTILVVVIIMGILALIVGGYSKAGKGLAFIILPILFAIIGFALGYSGINQWAGLFIDLTTLSMFFVMISVCMEGALVNENPMYLYVLMAFAVIAVFSIVNLSTLMNTLFAQWTGAGQGEVGTVGKIPGTESNWIGMLIVIGGIIALTIGIIGTVMGFSGVFKGFGGRKANIAGTILTDDNQLDQFLNTYSSRYGSIGNKPGLRNNIRADPSSSTIFNDAVKGFHKENLETSRVIMPLILTFIGLALLLAGLAPFGIQLPRPNMVAIYMFAAIVILISVLISFPQTDPAAMYGGLDPENYALTMNVLTATGQRQKLFDIGKKKPGEIEEQLDSAGKVLGYLHKKMRSSGFFGSGNQGIRDKLGYGKKVGMIVKSSSEVLDETKDNINAFGKQIDKQTGGTEFTNGLWQTIKDTVDVLEDAPWAETMDAKNMIEWMIPVGVICFIPFLLNLILPALGFNIWAFVAQFIGVPAATITPCFWTNLNIMMLLLWGFFISAAFIFIFNRSATALVLMLPDPIYRALETMFSSRQWLRMVTKLGLAVLIAWGVNNTLPAISQDQGWLFYIQPAIALAIFASIRFISGSFAFLELKVYKMVGGNINKLFSAFGSFFGGLSDLSTMGGKVQGVIYLISSLMILIPGLIGIRPEALTPLAQVSMIIFMVAGIINSIATQKYDNKYTSWDARLVFRVVISVIVPLVTFFTTLRSDPIRVGWIMLPFAIGYLTVA